MHFPTIQIIVIDKNLEGLSCEKNSEWIAPPLTQISKIVDLP